MATVELQQASKTYRKGGDSVPALVDARLTVEPGEFVAVHGPSGCGKTTLLLVTGGLLAPDGGQVLVDGQDLYALGSDQRARFRAGNIGFVFQQFHLVPYLTVLENVMAPVIALQRNDARSRAEELIDRFGMTSRMAHAPAELSTGERQRVALARAMMNQPILMLADEPTGNLDEHNSQIVLNALAEFASDGRSVLLVTHDRQAASAAGRQLHMQAGKLQEAPMSGTNADPVAAEGQT